MRNITCSLLVCCEDIELMSCVEWRLVQKMTKNNTVTVSTSLVDFAARENRESRIDRNTEEKRQQEWAYNKAQSKSISSLDGTLCHHKDSLQTSKSGK